MFITKWFSWNRKIKLGIIEKEKQSMNDLDRGNTFTAKEGRNRWFKDVWNANALPVKDITIE